MNISISTMFSERSTRQGGQKMVTVPWLLPAKRAMATAMPNRARNQRAARMNVGSPQRPAAAVASAESVVVG